VPRLELLERLGKHPDRPLVMVSAPAGYGKSTVVSYWLEGCGKQNAWLSLDKNDDDLHQFLAYLLAAIQTMFPHAVKETMALINVRNLPPEALLSTTLVNEIEKIDQKFIVVLDDIHTIKNKAVNAFIGLLIHHPPPSMQLVLVGRRDPVLPISSLRARGILTELRMRDLRFTEDEIVRYLQAATKYEIKKEITEVLAKKTEGWVTGLRLAVLAMHGQKNPGQKLLELKGTTRYVVDYLVSEVLDQQPAGLGRFLMAISILDRFCAPLCDALCEGDHLLAEAGMDGREVIGWLQKNNLFVIPLDTENKWFRYHHLFQQLLQRQFHGDLISEKTAELHGRAGDWFESQGFLEEALTHAIRGGHDEKAADLVEKYRGNLLNDDKWYVLEKGFRMIPKAVRETRPALLLADAWSAYERFQFERLARVVEKITSLVNPESTDPSLLGELSLLQGELHYWSGEGALSLKCFEAARIHLPEQQGLVRGLLELQYHLALCMEGDTEKAINGLDTCISETGERGGIYLSRLVAGLYFVYYLSGDLLRGRVEAKRLHRVAAHSNIIYTDTWSAYMRACTHFQANELAPALEYFTWVVQQRYIMHARAAVDSIAGLALTQQLLKQHDAASLSLTLLETFAMDLGDAQYMGIAHSCRARVALLRKDVTAALEWARTADENTAPAGLFMWLEVPAITQARVLIADGALKNIKKAIVLLDEVQQCSENCHFVNQVIECTLLQSVALDKMGHSDKALTALNKAVALSESTGWVRPFVEAGPSITGFLMQLQRQEVAEEFIQRLLTARKNHQSDVSSKFTTQPIVPSPQISKSAPPSQPLVEPLTHRELDVLELFSQRLQNKEIAEHLSISSVTVKSHLRSIYQKLQVFKRREAVLKATKLGILPLK
jgi:LuxR family maltose regulon positive regulatory protein